MQILVGILGCVLILIILWDVFETIILPRRVSRKIRLTRLYYLNSWRLVSGMARRMRPGKVRERYLGFFGPLSLLFLFVIWGIGLIVGFAMIHWAIGSKISAAGGASTFRSDLYFSGTTFFTLGLGDIAPMTPLSRFVTVLEAGTGFGIESGPFWQAKMTFAMARHALVDLAQVFNTSPLAPEVDRLQPETLAQMRRTLAAAGLNVRDGDEVAKKLAELCRMYEPYVN